ncbi:MAG: hypothetical protein IJ523_02010 [Succinivibrionaceae bacterium]|nr:hypothetical protein [Succinivibrionaceae bacterium]
MGDFSDCFNEYIIAALVVLALTAIFCAAIYFLSRKYGDEYSKCRTTMLGWSDIFW